MPKHLLIVDDEEEIRAILRDALTASGYRVTAVATVAEAVHAVQVDPPALLITDLQLGNSDGFEVIARVKALAPNLPIVMLTGVIMNPAEIPPEIGRQIAAYVPKTVSLSQLMQEVERCAS